MKGFKSVMKTILNDLKVELTDEFDQNFERKAFFDTPWADTKLPNPIGSLMMRTGALRDSIMSDVESEGIHFTSSVPYAAVHNEGGTFKKTITPQMRKWAFAMFKTTKNAIYKGIALSKKDHLTITIPKRQFIGDHPKVDEAIEQVVEANVKEYFDALMREMGAVKG